MSLIIDDFYCKACSDGDCSHHIFKTSVTDAVTSLDIKILCACPKHNTK